MSWNVGLYNVLDSFYMGWSGGFFIIWEKMCRVSVVVGVFVVIDKWIKI